MIRFGHTPKDKAANTNTPAKDVAPVVAPTADADKETENVAGPLLKAEAAKSADV